MTDVENAAVDDAIAENESAEATSEENVRANDPRMLVVERLMRAHEGYFDVSQDYEYAGQTFPAYAEFHSHGEKYVLTRKAKLWEVDAHEYLFFQVADALADSDVTTWIQFMVTEALKKVDPVPNHMTSCISLVLVANAVTDDAQRVLRKTRFHKEFKFGFRGWADLRLAAVDLSAQKVFTNAAGGEMRAALEANAGIECSKKSLFKKR